jgi:hypothetical protein
MGTFQECLFSLKNMKIFKSPGIDGFTVEFYKFFWNDINSHLTTSPLVGFVINGLVLLKKRSTWDLLIIGSVFEYNFL